jgi:U3 small nucleolar RNA-associated protein 10
LLAIISALITPKTGATPSQRILTLLVVLNDRSGWTQGLGDGAIIGLREVKDLGLLLVTAMEKYGFEEAMRVVLPGLLDK